MGLSVTSQMFETIQIGMSGMYQIVSIIAVVEDK